MSAEPGEFDRVTQGDNCKRREVSEKDFEWCFHLADKKTPEEGYKVFLGGVVGKDCITP